MKDQGVGEGSPRAFVWPSGWTFTRIPADCTGAERALRLGLRLRSRAGMVQSGSPRFWHGRVAAATLVGIGAMTGAVSAQTITEFPIPTALAGPEGITAGPDGNLWFTQFRANKIGRISPAGSIIDFSVPTAAT